MSTTLAPPNVTFANEVPPLKFWGWYDPDKKKPAVKKLVEAMGHFTDKFGTTPRFCLCNHLDADAIPEGLPIEVTGRGYIPRHTFYVGHTDVWELREEDDDASA